MSTAMRELRSAVMILVEASWKDESGSVKTIPAGMEDRSLRGACIRVNTPIGVGSKLRIRWRFDQFSGVTKYCRRDGREFLVGILRDKSSISGPPAKTDTPLLTGQREPVVVVARSGHILATGMGHETKNRHRLRISRLQGPKVLRRTEVRAKQPAKGREGGKERRPMKRKWLELAPGRNKQQGLSVSGDVSGEVRGEAVEGGERTGEGQKEIVDPLYPGPRQKLLRMWRRTSPRAPRWNYCPWKIFTPQPVSQIRAGDTALTRWSICCTASTSAVCPRR